MDSGRISLDLTATEAAVKKGACLVVSRVNRERVTSIDQDGFILSWGKGDFVEEGLWLVEHGLEPTAEYQESEDDRRLLEEIAKGHSGSSSALDYAILSGDWLEVHYEVEEQEFVAVLHVHLLYHSEPGTKTGSGKGLLHAISAAIIAEAVPD